MVQDDGVPCSALAHGPSDRLRELGTRVAKEELSWNESYQPLHPSLILQHGSNDSAGPMEFEWYSPVGRLTMSSPLTPFAFPHALICRSVLAQIWLARVIGQE